jgi:hypothetical protein
MHKKADGMKNRQKAKAVTRETYYQPSLMIALLALAVAFLLAWHGAAKAAPAGYVPQFQAIPVPSGHGADTPTPTLQAPSHDTTASRVSCTDTMDMAPEDAATSPFDADRVAFHGQVRRLRIAAGNACQYAAPVSAL